jgi:flagellar basal-body rod modification protein FlgD
MEIAAFAGNSISSRAQASDSTQKALSSDFETFLKMLTAQMQNQDPLNPIESTDYAVQLATFSAVEQQVKTNDLLTAVGRQLGGQGLGQVAGWVGMEARVDAPAYFDGSPLTIYPPTNPNADTAILVVADSTGSEISRQPIDPNSVSLDWAGVDAGGQPLPVGNYSFRVESMKDGKVVGAEQAQVYALVKEAVLADGVLNIVLEGGAQVSTDSVLALRTASS